LIPTGDEPGRELPTARLSPRLVRMSARGSPRHQRLVTRPGAASVINVVSLGKATFELRNVPGSTRQHPRRVWAVRSKRIPRSTG
jgi:hypothetical protein